MKRLTIFTLIAVFAAVTTGCATDEYGNPRPMTDAEKGAIIGAASGRPLVRWPIKTTAARAR